MNPQKSLHWKSSGNYYYHFCHKFTNTAVVFILQTDYKLSTAAHQEDLKAQLLLLIAHRSLSCGANHHMLHHAISAGSNTAQHAADK